jgi:hypothetical protein
MALIMNDRQQVAKKPLSAVSGNGLRRVLPDTAPAFIASVYCQRLLYDGQILEFATAMQGRSAMMKMISNVMSPMID